MALTLDQIVGYQRAEFDRASSLRTWLIFCQFMVAIPGAVSVLVEDGVRLYYLAGAGAALLALWLYLDSQYRKHRSAGERARRATLIMGGLGKPISPAELLALQGGFKVSTAQGKLREDPNYFATRVAPGLRRLGEMVEESAFWSADLHRWSATAMGALSAALLVLLAVTAFLAIPFTDTPKIMSALRILLALLVFGLSSDVLAAVRGHHQAAAEIRDVLAGMQRAAAEGHPEADVLYLTSEYNAAVEAAPVVVPLVYKLRCETLNQQWTDYQTARDARVPARA